MKLYPYTRLVSESPLCAPVRRITWLRLRTLGRRPVLQAWAVLLCAWGTVSLTHTIGLGAYTIGASKADVGAAADRRDCQAGRRASAGVDGDGETRMIRKSRVCRGARQALGKGQGQPTMPSRERILPAQQS